MKRKTRVQQVHPTAKSNKEIIAKNIFDYYQQYYFLKGSKPTRAAMSNF